LRKKKRNFLKSSSSISGRIDARDETVTTEDDDETTTSRTNQTYEHQKNAAFVCLFVFVSSSRRAQFGRRGRNGFEEAKKR